jgi:hypothetical protein
MYTASDAYVFGVEQGDGMVTLTIPKDRFTKEPRILIVKAEMPKE